MAPNASPLQGSGKLAAALDLRDPIDDSRFLLHPRVAMHD